MRAMALDKENLKKGILLALVLVAMGIGLPYMMGKQEASYFMVELHNGTQVLTEVADSPEKQVIGLFFAKELPLNRALLYLYDEEDTHGLWTKNVHFPVDMIWMDRDRSILHIQNSAPPCSNDPCPVYGPSQPESMYVLQAANGFAKTHALQPGMRMTFRMMRSGG